MVKYSGFGSETTIDPPSDLKPQTAPYDPRFPNQNQTRYCYVSFVDFQRCKKQHGEEHDACQYFKKVYTAICPIVWVERWTEQIAEGTFPKTI
ncbi:Cytochrome c oxidase subunit 6B2 [Eufriesea mexicana]|uniref:Cytochrome c oxidase subunit 6B1 n=1 Tax=Eufriesea mexicana TaxID=516756 RepID=A0A310SP88_9HYME|nr:PREDICTED: cytochrome c oxidase subunit 6B2-like isoform X2 [Eufriesea mexicana]XP_017758824.1 PREDICTED: cytochrome c oxidase subunit 6B2-like isoform X2 [Eufriesea mexicana]XP_017758825.1 PREDICTED: cytochrome c oxidase subunit 6B2-like isoform X2 [Eufriesea mexicana]XP_017758826.1 PREDICTED: cytochrome c oxidase subunit 6B2-like isoform X2 [Eufriesea mexicana]OAD56039.1 Cytochrome c oxidase subunit 6B2 [Eufriesea mexicana]